ncbi:MAG TPA: hypothetical protein VGC06_17535 [Actinomycetes bacterium]
MIPLNQLIPECLLALGAAFLLGNLAAYVRLRPAWREAKEAHGGRRGQAPAKRGNPRTGSSSTRATSNLGTGGGNARSTSGNRRPGSAKPRATSGNPRAETGEPGGSAAAAKGQARNRPGAPPATGNGSSASQPPDRRSAGAKAAAAPRSGTSGRVDARVRKPTPSRSLPSRTRVLVNVMIGFVVTIAALAALIRG